MSGERGPLGFTRGTCEQAGKLTAYFGERDRADGRLLADELLDLFGARATGVSILLRGALGFGAKHALRTDRLLTLSEDLPLVAIAVDARERIESLRAEAGRLTSAGLLTVEAVGMLADEPAFGGETAVSPGEGEAEVKLTVYIGRHERLDGETAFVAICRALREEGVAGASVLLGVDGTRHGHRRRARFVARNAHVPTMVLAVGRARPILATAARLRDALPTAPMTVERALICKRDGTLLASPSRPLGAPGALSKLTVVSSAAATHEGVSVHTELVRRLRAAGAAGATALRGVWGFHGEHEPHGDRWLSLRRHVPVMTELIDRPERIAELFPIVDELTGARGLVTCEAVPANMGSPMRL